MNPRIKKYLRLKAKAEKAAADKSAPAPVVAEAAAPAVEASPAPVEAKVYPPATKKAAKKTKRS